MSVIGKGSSSFKKQDVMEQKGIALGFKKVRFAHKATAGDTSITLTSLVVPTEMSSLGFTNPSPTTLVNAQLGIYRNNLKLVSSLRGLLVDQLSYVASSTAITFVGFTAEDGEIFQGWLDETPTTSLQVVDGATIVASGILAAGQTDFNIGTPITINKNPAQTIGAVMVFADRGLQYRKAGNITSGDGDYIEVPVAGGLGSLIRFNASGSDRFITVVSNGVVSERPDGSMMAAIERVQGQVDAMVPTLAQVAGVPETTFQTAPNDVNLKQFGDTVVANTAAIADHETRIDALEAPTYINGPTFTTTQTTTADTWVDVTGSSIVLPTGQWELVYQGMMSINNANGAAKQLYGNLSITDSSNVLQDGAMAFIGTSMPAVNHSLISYVHLTARVGAGTYKLRIRSSEAAASAYVLILPPLSDYTASLTTPDMGGKWYAKKVGV